jgi:hydrogenase expression/formation protein HypC
MCLGIPAVVKEVKDGIALVDFGDGVLREVYGGAYEEVKPGDIVVVHAGVIIEKLKEDRINEMVEMLNMFIGDLERKADELAKYFKNSGEG